MMKMKLFGATVLALACLVSGTETAKQNQTKGVLLEVLRHS